MNPNNPVKVTSDCTNLIEGSEHLELIAYLCPSNILSIAFGHVLLPKFDCHIFNMSPINLERIINECQKAKRVTREAKQLLQISRAQAYNWLDSDVMQTATCVRSLVSVELNQHQFDALTSFTFNVGQGRFAKSTLRQKLNAGDYAGAASEFLLWNKGTVNGVKQVLPGLVTRREAEKALFERAFP